MLLDKPPASPVISVAMGGSRVGLSLLLLDVATRSSFVSFGRKDFLVSYSLSMAVQVLQPPPCPASLLSLGCVTASYLAALSPGFARSLRIECFLLAFGPCGWSNVPFWIGTNELELLAKLAGSTILHLGLWHATADGETMLESLLSLSPSP